MSTYRNEKRHAHCPSHATLDLPELQAYFDITGFCPVQAIGTAFGREAFFRARHEEWTLEIADESGNLPSDGQAGPAGFTVSGAYSNAGWMPVSKAKELIEAKLREFANRQN